MWFLISGLKNSNQNIVLNNFHKGTICSSIEQGQFIPELYEAITYDQTGANGRQRVAQIICWTETLNRWYMGDHLVHDSTKNIGSTKRKYESMNNMDQRKQKWIDENKYGSTKKIRINENKIWIKKNRYGSTKPIWIDENNKDQRK